jgi:hypothetical protein
LQPVPEDFKPETLAVTGARLTLTQAQVKAAQVEFSGEGGLMLSGESVPLGQIKGRLKNLDQVLEGMAERGLIDDDQPMGAGAVLGLLGGHSANGLKVDVASRPDGLWIGPFRVAPALSLF